MQKHTKGAFYIYQNHKKLLKSIRIEKIEKMKLYWKMPDSSFALSIINVVIPNHWITVIKNM